MKKIFAALFFALAVFAAESKTFVVSRNGKKVSAFCDGKSLQKNRIDKKDPQEVLAAFFASYFKQSKDWKKFVSDFPPKELNIDEMLEKYKRFYGFVDSVSIAIDGEKFDSKSGFYTVKIAFSHHGESEEGEDEVSMRQNEKGEWLVADLPM